MDAGSREENASKQGLRFGFEAIRTEYAVEAAHARTHFHRRRLYAAFAADRISRATSCSRRSSAPGRWRTRFSWRCGCPIISARFSPKAPSTRRSCRPTRMSTASAARSRRDCSPTASSRCCSASQLVLLVVAWLFMPQAMSILAPGFTDDAEQRRLAIELTRITFPYLLLITLVTLYGGMLNVMHRFASAAAASIFLNLVDDDDAGAGGVLPERRPRRGLGRPDLRLPAIFSAGRRSRAPRRPAAVCAAQAR